MVDAGGRPVRWWRELPDDGVLERGVYYRFRVARIPEPAQKPEVMEVIRRAQARLIREHLEKRKRAS